MQDTIFYLTGSEAVIDTTADGITQHFQTWTGPTGSRIAKWLLLASGILKRKQEEEEGNTDGILDHTG